MQHAIHLENRAEAGSLRRRRGDRFGRLGRPPFRGPESGSRRAAAGRGQVPGTSVKGEEPKAAEPQTKPVTNSELASPLPRRGPDDRLAVPRLTAEPEPSPFNGALGIKAPAPVPVAPGDATPDADDPEKVATAFLEQNQKLAEAHLKTLKEEAEKLKARLLKVEAGIKRWDSLLEALKHSRDNAKTTPPAPTGLRLPALRGEFELLAVSGAIANYFLQPFESTIEPNGPSLEGKKVVILCNVTSGAVAEFPSLERDVPRILAEILRKKVKKITIVEPDKVATWVEAHPRYTEPADAARDFGADIGDLPRSRAISVAVARRPEHGARRLEGAHPGLRDGISQEQQRPADQGPAQGSPRDLQRIRREHVPESRPAADRLRNEP